MENTINPTTNNDVKNWTEPEQINEFYGFLQGGKIRGMTTKGKPKLSRSAAYSIIYYLQERLRILPDTIEQCSNCMELFDSNNSGKYSETNGKHYCDGCMYLAPEEIEE